MKYNIILWGTGERAKYRIKEGCFEECNIVGFIDTYKKEDSFMGYEVFTPEMLIEKIDKVDYLVIVTKYFAEIMEICIKLGIVCEKIVITDNVQEPIFYDKFLRLEKISSKLYDLLKDKQMRLIKINESDQRDTDSILRKDKYNTELYRRDYFRYRTFEFAADEIINNKIDGAVAEFGVFRGDFASLINEKFKEKKMYLFDTFEGFDAEEAEREVEMGRCDEDFIWGHKQTSLKRMVENLPNPENCIICKGKFPDSITEEASREIYSFVSIDVDFEESSYQGLKFFYPRLVDGGMIFMHDYNTFYLQGVKLAIKRYEKDYNVQLRKIPLADRAGTLVIIK